MKTKLTNLRRECALILTEVPGWPDAPRQVRFRRALPIIIPCVVLLLLVAWQKAVRDPGIRLERLDEQGLRAQENEVELLRLNCSEQQAGELAARSAAATRLIITEPKELPVVLQRLKDLATEQQWSGLFQTSDLSTSAVTTENPLIFLPVRAKLTSPPANSAAFSSLLVLFEQFSADEKRIDLTRMAIRADEQGRYTVELSLRLVGLSPNEKITQ